MTGIAALPHPLQNMFMPLATPVPLRRPARANYRPPHCWRQGSAGMLLACTLLLIGTGCQSAAGQPVGAAKLPLVTGATEAPATETPSLRHTDHALADRRWDVAAQRFVSRDEVIARLRTADVILLGETHDNPVHHRLQTELLAALLAAGRKPAVVMEQFDTEQQAALDAAGVDAASALMPRGWDATQYRPIIAAVREAGLVLAAGNVSRNATRPVIREGWQAIDAARRDALRLDAVWDAAREDYMRKVITASHCGQIDEPMRDGIVRAQRLRDAVLADVALNRRPTGGDGSVVFIVGRGHARSDVGVPRYLQARAGDLKVLSIGFTEVAPEKPAAADYLGEDGITPPGVPHDILWFTPRQTRPDPCKDFGKR